MSIEAGINGFGRFGQHLLKYWMENVDQADFIISYVNDANLSLEESFRLLIADKYYGDFFKHNLILTDTGLLVRSENSDSSIAINYTNSTNSEIPWLGKPSLFFECSGRNTDAIETKKFVTGRTKLVIISATSHNADSMLVYGHNHQEFADSHEIISYGSCTINAYVPLASHIHELYGIIDSSVNVMHNVPERLLPTLDAPVRRHCTLEDVAPKLLGFLSSDNFHVAYTLIPYSGVSSIDMRFRLKHTLSRQELIKELQTTITSGKLRGLYALSSYDKGPEQYKFSPFSADIVESGIEIKGDTVYLQAYFDNENSVNRYYDLAQYAVHRLQSKL